MVELFFGIISLIIPFLLLGLFSDKKRGFLYVLSFLFIFHTILAVLTQFFSVFNYWLIFSITLLMNILVIFYCFIKRKEYFFKISNLDWIIVLVIVVSVLSLYQIHYNFTGEISMVSDGPNYYHKVKNMEYVYPYFSDEWYAISIIEGSVNSHSLPLKNILDEKYFFNLEIFFHSLLAELFVLFGLNPLLNYTLVSVFANTLIIVLAYVFLRINNVSKIASAISSLSILYITSSANLPGIWNLIPITSGILFSLIGLSFLSINNIKMALLVFLMAFIFYPPLFPFWFLALLVYLFYKLRFGEIEILKFKKIVIALACIVVLGIILIFLFPDNSLVRFIKYCFFRLYFTSLTGNNFMQVRPYYVLPVFILVLSIFGIFSGYKKYKYLFFQIILGILFWLYYSFSINRFSIDYERVVFYTSIMTSLLAGFGLSVIERYFNLDKPKGKKILKYAEIITIVLFLLFIPFYSQRQVWKKIMFINSETGIFLYQMSPANNYLTNEDLEIFSNIKEKRFLSHPWKGLTIGVATGNYPVLTKEGNLVVGSREILFNFINSNCQNKLKVIKNNKIDYIYLDSIFSCYGIEKVNESSEGFILYKVISDTPN